ncbi:MAG: hypothetical protein RR733_04915 [Victivallaceae bacterium]
MENNLIQEEDKMLIWISIGVAIIVGAVCPLIFKTSDSKIEQVCEAYLKSQTGMDIDFSPEENVKEKKV